MRTIQIPHLGFTAIRKSLVVLGLVLRNSGLYGSVGTGAGTSGSFNTVSGSMIYVGIMSATAATSVTDNKGNTYVSNSTSVAVSTYAFVTGFYCASIVGGTGHTVTVNGASDPSFYVLEINNPNGDVAIDVASFNQVANAAVIAKSGSFSTGSFVDASGLAVFHYGYGTGGAVTDSIASPWTMRAANTDTRFWQGGLATAPYSSTSALSGVLTTTDSGVSTFSYKAFGLRAITNAIKFVKKSPMVIGNGTTTITLVQGTVVAGNLVTVQLGYYINNITSVVGSSGGAYTLGINTNPGNNGSEIWYRPNHPGGNENIVVTCSAGNYVSGLSAEFSGLNASSPLDKTSAAGDTGNVNSGLMNSYASAANSGPNSLVICVGTAGGGSNACGWSFGSPGGPFIELGQSADSNNFTGCLLGYKITTALETSRCQILSSGNGIPGGALITFKT